MTDTSCLIAIRNGYYWTQEDERCRASSQIAAHHHNIYYSDDGQYLYKCDIVYSELCGEYNIIVVAIYNPHQLWPTWLLSWFAGLRRGSSLPTRKFCIFGKLLKASISCQNLLIFHLNCLMDFQFISPWGRYTVEYLKHGSHSAFMARQRDL